MRPCGHIFLQEQAKFRAAAGARGLSSSDFAFRTLQLPVTKRTKGSEVRVVDSSQFKVSKNVAAAIVTVDPEAYANCIGIRTRTNGNTTGLPYFEHGSNAS